jgi:hypothetical protein
MKQKFGYELTAQFKTQETTNPDADVAAFEERIKRKIRKHFKTSEAKKKFGKISSLKFKTPLSYRTGVPYTVDEYTFSFNFISTKKFDADVFMEGTYVINSRTVKLMPERFFDKLKGLWNNKIFLLRIAFIESVLLLAFLIYASIEINKMNKELDNINKPKIEVAE